MTYIRMETVQTERKRMMERKIYNGIPWYDQNGNPVNAHGACIVPAHGKYYLFGEYKTDDVNRYMGFSCYSTENFMDWTFHGLALPPLKEGLLGPDRIGERVKVLENRTTGKYVMLMHTDDMRYCDPCIGLAVGERIDGEFVFQGPLLFRGEPIRFWDMGTFVDDDGTAYLLTHEGNIYRLDESYTRAVELVAENIAPGGESPAMFCTREEGNGKLYYLMLSNKTSWERNDNYYFTAKDLRGPWEYKGLFCPEGSLTYNSQCSFVFRYEGSEPKNFGTIQEVRQNQSSVREGEQVSVGIQEIRQNTGSMQEAWQATVSVQEARQNVGSMQEARQNTGSMQEARQNIGSMQEARQNTGSMQEARQNIGSIRETMQGSRSEDSGHRAGISIYMGDRWSYPRQASAATLVLLPIEAGNGGMWIPEYLSVWSPDTLKGADYRSEHSIAFRSNIRGEGVQIEFAGKRIALFGNADSHGGYADLHIINERGTSVFRTSIDFYSAVPDSGLRFLSPSLEYGKYTLRVSVSGENSVCVTKSGTIYGSDDFYIDVTGWSACG